MLQLNCLIGLILIYHGVVECSSLTLHHRLTINDESIDAIGPLILYFKETISFYCSTSKNDYTNEIANDEYFSVDDLDSDFGNNHDDTNQYKQVQFKWQLNRNVLDINEENFQLIYDKNMHLDASALNVSCLVTDGETQIYHDFPTIYLGN